VQAMSFSFLFLAKWHRRFPILPLRFLQVTFSPRTAFSLLCLDGHPHSRSFFLVLILIFYFLLCVPSTWLSFQFQNCLTPPKWKGRDFGTVSGGQAPERDPFIAAFFFETLACFPPHFRPPLWFTRYTQSSSSVFFYHLPLSLWTSR